MNFNVVTEFEKKISEFFGSPYAIAVDSCTHGIELCLRYTNEKNIYPFTIFFELLNFRSDNGQ